MNQLRCDEQLLLPFWNVNVSISVPFIRFSVVVVLAFGVIPVPVLICERVDGDVAALRFLTFIALE